LVFGCADSDPAVDAPLGCQEDRFGAAVEGVEAPRLDVGRFDELVACPDAPDVFRLARQDVLWTLAFRGESPVTVTLLDEADEVIVEGEGRDLVFAEVAASTFRVAGDGAEYEVLLTLADEQNEACNDGVAQPVVLEPGVYVGRLCPGGETRLRPQVVSGDLLRIDVSGDALNLVEAFESVGPELIRTHRWRGDSPQTLTRTQPRRDAVSLGLSGVPGSVYRVVLTTTEQALRSVRLAGRVEAAHPVVGLDGLGPRAPFVPAGARLALETESGLLATARLDGEGAFEVDALMPPDAVVDLSIVADIAPLDSDGHPMPSVRVSPEPDGTPWAEVLHSGTPEMPMDDPLVVTPSSAAEAALHVAVVAASGLEFMAPYLPLDRAPPPLTYRWRPQTAEDCGTCYREGPRPYIALSGRVSDPDEWDRTVILHELGHYIATVYGQDDSAGGPHDGRRATPTLAWSEGFAIFIAGVLGGDPTQLDYKVSTVRVFDLEVADAEAAFGTEDDQFYGDVSEHLVAAVLWDLYDDPIEDDEAFALPLDVILAPMFAADSRPDRGAEGYDFVDYLDGLVCGSPSSVTAVDALLSLRRFPYASPEACP